MRRLVAGLALALAVAWTLTMAANQAQAQPRQTIRFGVLPVLDTLPLHVAAREGLFEAQGLNIELVGFMSALERDTAMQAGRLDGYFGDLVATLLLIKAGAPLRVATIAYESSPERRMFGIVTSPRKAGLSLAELSGHSVSISRSTIIELLLQRMEAAHAIPAGAMVPLEIKKIPIRMQMLLAGEIDLALLPEPLLTLAESKGGTVLATDQKLAMPLTVLCLADRLADAATLERFLAAYGEALRRLAASPETYRGLMAEVARIPPELKDSFPMYRYPAPRLPAPQEIEDVQAWMLGQGLLSERIAYERLVPAR